jgi:hypothetical protein
MNKVKKLERRSIVCSKNNFLKKGKNKTMKKYEKKKKKKKPKVSLILSHINHTLFILDLQLDPKPLNTLIVL